MEPTSLSYRPDIDGLRALAILPVVWFHSDLPGLAGGFTGVDTFFVISGYLITRIIYGEMCAGTFHLRSFYERRLRRIAPAMLLMIAASTAVSFWLLLPYELEQFARSASAALVMVSNVFFWKTGGYFSLADSTVPLLHTWSLGVEEQFYLLFPAALLVAGRLRLVRSAIAAFGIGSFILCVAVTAHSPPAAFYLLPTRGWELMIGAAFAVGLLRISPKIAASAAAAGMLLMIASSVLISGADPFPGWRALLPATGAALVIGSGPGTPVGRVLANGALRYVGKISYSLYLWHWPIFVFLREWRADTRLPWYLSLAGIALAFGLSAASYRWIEQPSRRRSTPFNTILAGSAGAATMVLIAIVIGLTTNGLPQRLPKRVDEIASAHFAYAPLAHSCTDIGFDAALRRCRTGRPGEPKFVIWGDSHAAAISEGVAVALAHPGIVLSIGGCPPALAWSSAALAGADEASCRKFNEAAFNYIATSATISTVVLSAYWRSKAYSDSKGGPAAFWAGVQQTVDALRSHGKSVVVIGGIPDPQVDVPWATAIRARFGRPAIQLSCPRAEIPVQGARVIDVSASFCRYAPQRLFTDSNHASRFAGLNVIAPAVERALRH